MFDSFYIFLSIVQKHTSTLKFNEVHIGVQTSFYQFKYRYVGMSIIYMIYMRMHAAENVITDFIKIVPVTVAFFETYIFISALACDRTRYITHTKLYFYVTMLIAVISA